MTGKKKGIAMTTDMLIMVVMIVIAIFIIFLLYLSVEAESAPASSSVFYWFIDWILGITPGVL